MTTYEIGPCMHMHKHIVCTCMFIIFMNILGMFTYACNLPCTLLPCVQSDSYATWLPCNNICGELYMLYAKAFAYACDRCGSITKLCVLHVHAALVPCAQWSGQHDCGLCTVVEAIHKLCSICPKHVHLLAIVHILLEAVV